MPRYLKIVYEYFALYSSLTLLGLICLAWSIIALPLFFLLPPRAGTAVGRRGIMLGFRIYAWSLAITRVYRLDISDIDSLKGGALDVGPQSPLSDRRTADPDAIRIVCTDEVGPHEKRISGSGSRLARYIRTTRRAKWSKNRWPNCATGQLCRCFPGTRTIRAPINCPVGSVGLIAACQCTGANPGDRN
jgi:hypothetical protein